MKPSEFIKTYKPHALAAEEKTGVPYMAILCQAAIESGWGKTAPGNMFFGVKDRDGLNGNEQLLTTTEYSKFNNLTFPVIISITPVVIDDQKWFKYKIKDYFRRYDSATDSFTDHGLFLKRNKRYKLAFEYVKMPRVFLKKVAEAGYATDPKYYDTLMSVYSRIEKTILSENTPEI